MNRVRAGQGVFYAGYVDAEQDADDHRQDDKDREQLIDETELGRLLGPPACYLRSMAVSGPRFNRQRSVASRATAGTERDFSAIVQQSFSLQQQQRAQDG
jgi:hypothetical protein